MKYTRLLIFLLFLSRGVICQEYNPDKGTLYDESVIPKIYIEIDPLALDSLYEPGNEESDHYYSAEFIFDNGSLRDTINNIGFRFRGNTSRYAAKKSFKIAFDAFNPGKSYKGVEKLNINGEHNDPSVMRSKLSWDIMRNMNVPASRSNHVELFFNNVFQGLYLNVEHIDEEFVKTRFGPRHGNLFKCLYPADLTYLGSDPENYKFEFQGRKVYELKTNELEDDYSGLARFKDILNNTPIADLPCELESVFNVNTFLKALAVDILIGNWDGPIFNKNNFYLYQDPKDDIIHYIPYDLDNTFGIDWFGIDWGERSVYNWSKATEPRPLYRRILQVPEYRKRFSFYLQQVMEQHFNQNVLGPKLDSFQIKLINAISRDPLYALDYGYDVDDFRKSFTHALSTNHTPYGLKPYIQRRFSTATAQVDIQPIAPVLTNLQSFKSADTYFFQVNGFDEIGLAEMNLCWLDASGESVCHEMKDDGLSNDAYNGDGIYGTSFLTLPELPNIQYYVEARDETNLSSRIPLCGYMDISNSQQGEINLVINELMASNDDFNTDEAGEYDDWFELFNPGNEAVYLGDKYVSDKADNPVKWQLPDVWIESGKYVLLWADEDGEQGDFHANFKLKASGEQLGLFDSDSNGNEMIDLVMFSDLKANEAYGRWPNGTGNFRLVHPTPGRSNQFISSLKEIQDNEPFQITPNPFSNVFYVSRKLEISMEASIQFRIVDMLGNLQEADVLDLQGQWKIELKDQLPGGVYILLVLSNHQILQQSRLIKSI